MNRFLSNLSKITLGIVIVAGAASCGQNASNTASNKSDSTSNSNSSNTKTADKIVYVNADTLSAQYEFFKDAQAKLEGTAKKAQENLQSKGQAFQRELAEAEQKAATMSASERQATEERLARKQQELAQLNQNASASLAQDEQNEMTSVYNSITDYLTKHAQEKGYQYVLTYSKTNPAVIYADAKLDITKEVVEALNKEYKAKKGTEKK
ncbi:OmpH family outer membrane protein [Sphingobacterium bovistauri]|uniref:OmpH family outer membrane protein n=1 Tax=Sphingobacterium bovistauri TaxID=2781959 RepID=A0ABS7Z5V8_9SPHI|nr:OmpH family outer membrane protein [Sphingobacterium bovistauri]MCA5005581.1 OmpH family outer membrane protein [Sphingobacterium bovistauri]